MKEVFSAAIAMQGSGNPAHIDEERARIAKLEKDLAKWISFLLLAFAFVLSGCGGPPFAAPLFGAEELGAGGKAESATVASSTAQSTAETSSASEEAASSSSGSTHPIATSSAATGSGGAGGAGGAGSAASVASSTGEGGAPSIASSSTTTEAASTAASSSSGSGGASPCTEGPIEAPDGEHKCYLNSAHTLGCPTNSPSPRDGCVYAGPVSSTEDMWCCT